MLTGKVSKYNYQIVFIALLFPSFGFQFYHHDERRINYFHSLSCMGSLIIGAISAYWSFYSARFLNFFLVIQKHFIFFIYISGFALIFLNFYVPNSYFFTGYQIVISIFFVFIILEQNFARHSFFKLGRLSLFSYLGRISYGLYILHPLAIFIVALAYVDKGVFSFFTFWQKFLLSFMLSILMAYASFNYFEKFFLKLKSKFEK